MPPPMKYRFQAPEETLAIKQDRGHPCGLCGRGSWEAKVSGKHLALGPGGPTRNTTHTPPPRTTLSSASSVVGVIVIRRVRHSCWGCCVAPQWRVGTCWLAWGDCVAPQWRLRRNIFTVLLGALVGKSRQVLHRPPGMGYPLFQRATLKHTNWSILNPFVYHVMPGPLNLRLFFLICGVCIPR